MNDSDSAGTSPDLSVVVPVWNEEKPPAGTLYNYMLQGDETLFIAGDPAPPLIAANIFETNFFVACNAGPLSVSIPSRRKRIAARLNGSRIPTSAPRCQIRTGAPSR